MQLSNHVDRKGREIEGQVGIALLRVRKALLLRRIKYSLLTISP
jgi:hypothetical protein